MSPADAPEHPLLAAVARGEVDGAVLERLAELDTAQLRATLGQYLTEDEVEGIVRRIAEVLDARR